MRFYLILLALSLTFSRVQAEPPPTPKLLILGIDGCRPDALLLAKTTHLAKLSAEGAFSDLAQTGDMTISGPGWGSMLTGVWREKHGVRDNRFENMDFKTYPHFFTRLKQHASLAKTASIVHWGPINEKIISACDHVITRKTDAAVADEAEKILARPDIDAVFIHFDDVDGAGHKHGFHPKLEPYLKAIEQTDKHVGRLLNVLAKRPERKNEDWLILVSTDHGGRNKSHGGNTSEERTIFVIAHGTRVGAKKWDRAPAIVDIAVTALDHLRVPLDPAWKLDGQSLLSRSKKE